MAQFEATVRLFELVEADAVAARQTLEERLREAGFTRWQISSVKLESARTPAVPVPEVRRRTDQRFVAVIVVAWLLWFLWLLFG